ncbi:hypothetical protein EST38_g10848 [Candolleomyces aberdarensis]|uniref:Uncharacterized protein n=1 Tax=Candolleomyces aberdarensis TaxID=2316362 RepID=A0A4V1Q2G5_9AGAR|nr:hypothetical protein EST38_g10848 [Candolleomyces aberdarensis]
MIRGGHAHAHGGHGESRRGNGTHHGDHQTKPDGRFDFDPNRDHEARPSHGGYSQHGQKGSTTHQNHGAQAANNQVADSTTKNWNSLQGLGEGERTQARPSELAPDTVPIDHEGHATNWNPGLEEGRPGSVMPGSRDHRNMNHPRSGPTAETAKPTTAGVGETHAPLLPELNADNAGANWSHRNDEGSRGTGQIPVFENRNMKDPRSNPSQDSRLFAGEQRPTLAGTGEQAPRYNPEANLPDYNPRDNEGSRAGQIPSFGNHNINDPRSNRPDVVDRGAPNVAEGFNGLPTESTPSLTIPRLNDLRRT